MGPGNGVDGLEDTQQQNNQAEDIRLFKTSLLARRFPGLQKLSDEDILQLIEADSQAAKRRQEDPRMNRTYPKTLYPIPQPKRETLGSLSPQKPPFSPVSPAEAREQASRPHDQRYVNCFTPYESDRQCFIADRTTDRIKDLQPPFRPICPSQAQETIQADYYLYSPKPEEKQAERDAIRERSTANRQQLRELFATRRGHTLV